MNTGFHILHWICNIYRIQIPFLSRSRRNFSTCLKTWRRGRGEATKMIVTIMGPIPTKGGGGVEQRREEEEVGN